MLTDVDVLETKYLCTIVFGLKMNSKFAQDLIEKYYQFLELGTPFLSCFPEKFVLSSIIGMTPEKRDIIMWRSRLLKQNVTSDVDTSKMIQKAEKKGYYFYHRKH